jgi:hypothetical protein
MLRPIISFLTDWRDAAMRRIIGVLGVILLIFLLAQPAAGSAAPDTGGEANVPSLMLKAGGSTGTHAIVASLDGVTPDEKAHTSFGGQNRWLMADDGGNGGGDGGDDGGGDDFDDDDDWEDSAIDLWRSKFREACRKGKYINLGLVPEVKKDFEKEFWAEFEAGVKVNMERGMTESDARMKMIKDREGALHALYGRTSIILIKEIPKTGDPPNRVHLEALNWTKSLAIAKGFSGYTPTEEEEKILKKIEVNWREIGILNDERRSICTREVWTFAPDAALRTVEKTDKAVIRLMNRNKDHEEDLKKVWKKEAAKKRAAKQKATK